MLEPSVAVVSTGVVATVVVPGEVVPVVSGGGGGPVTSSTMGPVLDEAPLLLPSLVSKVGLPSTHAPEARASPTQIAPTRRARPIASSIAAARALAGPRRAAPFPASDREAVPARYGA